MLVLTRKMDEQILIGDNIKITLLRVRGNSVRIGIEAPREVRVVRSELERAVESTSNAPANDATGSSERPADRPTPAAGVRVDASTKVSDAKDPASVAARVASGDRRMTQTAASSPSHAKSSDARQVFVGSVRRDGHAAELRRSPLASFLNTR